MRRWPDCSCFDGVPKTPLPTTPKTMCLDTTCRNCGHAIEHTGTGGIAWLVKGAKDHTGSTPERVWECRCKETGAAFHAHAPDEVVTLNEVHEAVASIMKGSTDGAT